MSEKTEKPTPKKLRDLKKKGDVTKSEEVMAAVQSLILFLFFLYMVLSFFIDIVGLVNTAINSLNRPFLYAIREILGSVLNILLLYILPISLIVFVGTVATGVSQTGFIFAVEKIKPSAQKISVKNNLKNIFSVKSIFELFKSVFKLVIIALIFYFMGHSYASEFINFTNLNAYQTLVLVAFFVFFYGKVCYSDIYSFRYLISGSRNMRD